MLPASGPSTDYAAYADEGEEAPKLELRACPLGELSPGRPLFWDDHGYFEVRALPDRSQPERLNAYFYTFRCSSMMRTALGAPYAGTTFPRRVTAEALEPFLKVPPLTPKECLAWAQEHLPCEASDSHAQWLVLKEAPEWNDVFRWLAHCETDHIGFCAMEFDRGQLASSTSGLPPEECPRTIPAFEIAGQSWAVDGDGFKGDDVAIDAATFLRSLLAVTSLAHALEETESRLDGAMTEHVSLRWKAGGLNFEVFGRALPF